MSLILSIRMTESRSVSVLVKSLNGPSSPFFTFMPTSSFSSHYVGVKIDTSIPVGLSSLFAHTIKV